MANTKLNLLWAGILNHQVVSSPGCPGDFDEEGISEDQAS